MTDFWTPEKEELLRRIYPDKTSTICAEMLGTTRNAVISKAKRLKITRPAIRKPVYVKPPNPTGKWNDKQVMVLTEMYHQMRTFSEIATEVSKYGAYRSPGGCGRKANDIGLVRDRMKCNRGTMLFARKNAQKYSDAMTLEKVPHIGEGCLWPFGDVGALDFHFCGGKIHKGAYCDEHYKVSRGV